MEEQSQSIDGLDEVLRDIDRGLCRTNETEGDETEYKNFCRHLYGSSAEETIADANTDDNDPPYVFNDHIFSPGWRLDLEEELQEVALERVETPNKHGGRKIDMFEEPEFKRTLNQQLRQHIQLLTQAYLLTKNSTNMQDEANEAKSHLLNYMKIFKDKTKPSNLLPAMDLVKSYGTRDIKSYVRLSWRHLPIPETVRSVLDSRREIFIYESLLPEVAFSLLPEKLVTKKTKKAKIIFTTNEDKLLAYALNEFKSETSQYAYIASLLMAAKTKIQISNHIKNIKRMAGNENHPVKLYLSQGQLPAIDLDADAKLRNIPELSEQDGNSEKEEPDENVDGNEMLKQHFEFQQQQEQTLRQQEQLEDIEKEMQHEQEPSPQGDPSPDLLAYHNHDDMMNMDLDDLMAASTTISKPNNNGCRANTSERNIKHLKLRSSMLELMSNQFSLSKEMGDLIVEEFINTSQSKLSERDHLHLLQLMADLMRKETRKPNSEITIYNEILKFLKNVRAPSEIQERLVLFLNLEQATKCGCALSYLHWMRFFEFIHHVELYHEGETIEKKLARLIDALQKDDPHRVKLAATNLINKHPLLKSEFDSLELDGKPHPSLFISDEDFDDVTDPMTVFQNNDETAVIESESFELKPTVEELNFASPSCPCNCHHHPSPSGDKQPQQLHHHQNMELGQHCNKCNLKFMKGRMYLVSKIKPFLAEWSYMNTAPSSEASTSSPVSDQIRSQSHSAGDPCAVSNVTPEPLWTFEEDKEILEFCRAKAETNDENISFDVSTFEELVSNRSVGPSKKSAREITERFNQLMEMYRVEGS